MVRLSKFPREVQISLLGVDQCRLKTSDLPTCKVSPDDPASSSKSDTCL